jgi:subtilase family serine protease
MMGLAAVPAHAAVTQGGRTAQPERLSGAVPSMVSTANARLLGAYSPSAKMSTAFVLRMRNQTGLDSLIAAMNDPSNPGYHHYLTLKQENAAFNPTVAQQRTVETWLRSKGLTVTHTYRNHLIVDAQGTVGQFEHALKISINRYSGMEGTHHVSFYAPAKAPTIPAKLSGIVHTVVGLDSVPRFHMSTNGTAHNATPYYPQDFANAYDVNSLWSAGDTGSGQHIGITLWTVPPSDTTLSHFGSVTGAAVATTANGKLKVIKVDGGTTTADDGEAGMDIEYSGGIAYGATIDYYEAPTSGGNPTNQGLIDSLNQAGSDSNNNLQITNSWGGCEATSTSDSFTSGAEAVFQSNSATGHNYFFSSGDNGSWCNSSPFPDYPTDSRYVTSVGGTKFNATVNGSWPGESAWAYCSNCNSGEPEGSGGGYSNLFSRPSWQTGTGLAANGKRGYPDISADADPNTGAEVCYGSSSSCAQIGGTSLASPLWAGMSAVTNQYLSSQSKPSLGFLDPTLYSLANTSQTYAPFHDVTSGTNGSYNAGTGWDAVTGWGSTDLYNLARDVAGSGSGTPTPTPTPSPTPTSTPTATPTPSPTPSPTPTSTPPPSQLIVNGGFESGQSPWSESSSGGYQIVDPTNPHSGSYSAYLCGYNKCNDQIWQTVTLPSSLHTATLTYWVYISTQESGSTCYDYLYTRLRTSTGSTITTPQTLCNANHTGWVQKSFNVYSSLSSYAGKSVEVYFQGTTDSSLITEMFVDDVTLNVS